LDECLLERLDFGWSLDGTGDGDIISRRAPSGGSLVENVRAALGNLDPTPANIKAEKLLAYASENGGNLVDHDHEHDVGYLMPDEISRLSTLLAAMTFADPWEEGDRQLLLRLFTIALENKCGLFWTWA
jgi:hypothetical protein